jgi:Polymerase beta, Nucleotidyltransferase
MAERLAETLLERVPDVEAICLFGSVARGDDGETSDIDLLLLGSEALTRQDALAGAIPDGVARELLSPRCCTRAQLELLFENNPSFAAHIGIEGVVLGDRTGFLQRLRSQSVRDITTEDIRRAASGLERFDDLTRFGDDFLSCLSELYLIGRLMITLSLLRDGFPIFERRRAFATWRQLHPTRSDQVGLIEQLAPFFLLARRGRPQPLPFSPHGSSQEAARAVAAIRSVAGE